MVDFSSLVYDTNAPSGLYLLGYAGVGVVGAMLRWNAFWSVYAYISGDITAPAHPLTGDWGHGIFLSAFAKCFLSSRMLKKLGRGLMLGGFANSVRTASYEITVFIFPRGSNNIRLLPMGYLGVIVLRFLPLNFVSFNKLLVYNNCQM